MVSGLSSLQGEKQNSVMTRWKGAQITAGAGRQFAGCGLLQAGHVRVRPACGPARFQPADQHEPRLQFAFVEAHNITIFLALCLIRQASGCIIPGHIVWLDLYEQTQLMPMQYPFINKTSEKTKKIFDQIGRHYLRFPWRKINMCAFSLLRLLLLFDNTWPDVENIRFALPTSSSWSFHRTDLLFFFFGGEVTSTLLVSCITCSSFFKAATAPLLSSKQNAFVLNLRSRMLAIPRTLTSSSLPNLLFKFWKMWVHKSSPGEGASFFCVFAWKEWSALVRETVFDPVANWSP